MRTAPVSPNCAAIANRPEADRVVSPYPMGPAPFSAVLPILKLQRTYIEVGKGTQEAETSRHSI